MFKNVEFQDLEVMIDEQMFPLGKPSQTAVIYDT